MYKLVSAIVNSPIDRIRGAEEILINMECTFVDNQEYRTVTGVAVCKSVADIPVTGIKDALNNAELQLTNLGINFESNKKTNQMLSKVMKAVIAPSVATEVKKSNRSDLDKMYELADETKQVKITGLCEALGIDIIDVVTNEWTNVEVLILTNYLEKMTEPLLEA